MDNNNMRIAGLKTIDEWNNLSSILDVAKNDNWDKAFDFFDKRIKTRYLNPIDEILRMRSFLGEGFATVNLQCPLIETIECFVNGWKYEYPYFIKPDGSKFRNNKEIFKSFFDNRNELEQQKGKGESFYILIRNGLLHETQTKGNWKIKRNDSRNEFDWYEEKGGFNIVYSYQLNNVLKSLIYRYRKAILFGEQFDEITSENLRTNFIQKMNHICDKS